MTYNRRMKLKNERWLVKVVKRTGETFTGTTRNDGLQSLWYVTTPTGEQKIASVLDTIYWQAQMEDDE